MKRGLSLSALGLALAGCASQSHADKVKDDLAQVKAERAPDKLVDRGLAFANVGDLTRAEQYLAAALDRKSVV